MDYKVLYNLRYQSYDSENVNILSYKFSLLLVKIKVRILWLPALETNDSQDWSW